MAGLVPAIRLQCCNGVKTWMPATSAGMTEDVSGSDAKLGEVVLDFLAQQVRLIRRLSRGGQLRRRELSGFHGAVRHLRNVLGDIARAFRRSTGVSRNLLSYGILLAHRDSDIVCNFAELFDRGCYLLDCLNRARSGL